jgi:hypothetical protein
MGYVKFHKRLHEISISDKELCEASLGEKELCEFYTVMNGYSQGIDEISF